MKTVKYTLIPLAFTLTLLLVSILQAVYFRTDLRKLMLENGRRVKYKTSEGKMDWLFGANKLFDKNPQTAVAIPYHKKDGLQKAELLIELALTHFPFSDKEAIPAKRKPNRIELHNGACSQCDLATFQRKARIKEATIEIFIRKLDLPILDFIASKKTKIWEKRITFPDEPRVKKIDLSTLSFFPSQGNIPTEVGVVLLKLRIHSVYAGTVIEKNNDLFYLERVRYIDQNLHGKLYYWE